MKKILFIMLLLTSTLFSDEIKWVEYDVALKQAKKEDKVIMVMLGRSSCNVCKYMKDVVFVDKEVINEINSRFLAVYIELDFDDIPNNLQYIGTPTFHFLNKEEKTLYRIDGGKNIPSLMTALKRL